MLTNPHETEMVRSLGVRIGPAAAAAIANPGAGHGRRGGRRGAESPAAAAAPSPPCSAARRRHRSAGAAPSGPTWTPGALARLEAIPEMVRPMARAGIEMVARENGPPADRRGRARRGAVALRDVDPVEAARSRSRGALAARRRRGSQRGLRAPLRRLLEPHLPLQPRLRALLPRRRPRQGRDPGLRRPQRAGAPSSATGWSTRSPPSRPSA